MKVEILYLVFAFAVLTSAGAVQGKSHTPISCACYAWSTACLSMTTSNSCVQLVTICFSFVMIGVCQPTISKVTDHRLDHFAYLYLRNLC